ncbi:hypothetical protein KY308_00485 [Candidatus Woesearchaeota archaeon]|nr:hypothetical protein [Candidatus Woesearchaeota archaeon]
MHVKELHEARQKELENLLKKYDIPNNAVSMEKTELCTENFRVFSEGLKKFFVPGKRYLRFLKVCQDDEKRDWKLEWYTQGPGRFKAEDASTELLELDFHEETERDFAFLRMEFDAFGFDLVIDPNKIKSEFAFAENMFYWQSQYKKMSEKMCQEEVYIRL